MYSLDACNKVIQQYYDNNGEVIEVIDGSLGLGTTVCFGEGLKACIIQEVYLNEWSSGHKIRFYNVIPKKYDKMLNDWYNNN